MVREQGYALTSEELEDGLISLAAPVRDAGGSVVGVTACSTSAGRTSPEAFRADVAPFLVEKANQLSADMGYRS